MNKQRFKLALLFLGLVWAVNTRWQTAQAIVSQSAAHKALIEEYCIGCHNQQTKTADITLESLDYANVSKHAESWEKVLRKVRTAQMPPAKAPQPETATRAAFVNWLESALDKAAAAQPNPGRPVLHRLNRAEYSNAIRDLLALDIQPGAALPVDDSGYGFDNIGAVLSLSPALLEKYLSVAYRVSRAAVGDLKMKPTELDADYTYLNQRLAEHYGVAGVYGSQFRRVALTEAQHVNRGGLLGQGSILTVTSYPNRTSVVQRGKWILENLLGAPPPPPPPDIPDLKPHGEDGRLLSMREQLERHRANAVCASCHARMDPIGFALENYDGVGRWRTRDAGQTIDAAGKLPNGKTFTGLGELKQLLLTAHKDEYVTAVTEKLLTYALGRGLEHYDAPAVRAILREAAPDNYRLTTLIGLIVKSIPFQMRKCS